MATEATRLKERVKLTTFPLQNGDKAKTSWTVEAGSVSTSQPMYAYCPLPIGSIRLLRLYPHPDAHGTLQGEIFEYQLIHSTKGTHLYEALSYVWGPEAKVHPLLTNKGVLYVTENLFAALIRLRDPSLQRVIWADAVCINQNDTEERSRQVQYMAEIYAKASRVVVWLEQKAVGGLPGDLEATKSLYQALKLISEAANGRLDSLNSEASSHIVSTALQASWFERIWVLQEVAAARHVLIMCFDMDIDGQAFCAGLEALGFTDQSIRSSRARSAIYLIKNAGLRPKYINSSSTRFSLKVCSLAGLVDMYHSHKATDRRDKIFALLGMSSDAPTELLPDYTISWKEVFYRLIRYFIGNQILIRSCHDKEAAVLEGWSHMLGSVTSTSSVASRFDRQTVGVQLHFGDKLLPSTDQFQSWTVQASLNPIRKGDILLLLKGASMPTVVRPCGDYCAIIAISICPQIRNSSQVRSLDWPAFLRRIQIFPHSCLLIWDWGMSSESLISQHSYMDFMNRATTQVDMGLEDNLQKATRLCNIGLLLAEAKQHKEAVVKFQKAAYFYELERGNSPLQFCEAGTAEEDQKSPQVVAEQWWIMASIIGRRGLFSTATESGTIRIVRVFNQPLLKMLLDRYGEQIVITEEVIKEAARSEHGKDLMELLFERRKDQMTITEDVLKAAARNELQGRKIMELLLAKQSDIIVTSEVVKAAVENKSQAMAILGVLLDLQEGHTIITQETVEAAASNKYQGKEIVELLLERHENQLFVTKRMLIMAAANLDSGKDIMEFLVSRYKSKIMTSVEVLEAAARNERWGYELMELLLNEYRGQIVVTERLMKAAKKNILCGRRLIQLLSHYERENHH